jgi:hypothetical protein
MSARSSVNVPNINCCEPERGDAMRITCAMMLIGVKLCTTLAFGQGVPTKNSLRRPNSMEYRPGSLR